MCFDQATYCAAVDRHGVYDLILSPVIATLPVAVTNTEA
jgi:hypothetical protein